MLTLLEFALQNLLFIGLHLDSRSSFPKQLSPKEEEECIALIAQGDMDARGKLIEHNLRLVAYIVNKNYQEAVRGCQQDADDLISIGTIASYGRLKPLTIQRDDGFQHMLRGA